MALKKKISKDEFAKLPDAFKAEYLEDEDGYRLDISGEEDTGALRRAKDRESQLRREKEKEARELRERIEAIEGDDARKKGDIATLEKSWAKKLEDAQAAAQVKIDKLTSHTTKSLVDNVAISLANKISNAPNLILPHIRARLQASFEGDEPSTVVLGLDGKPSNLTVDALAAEFVANKDFASIITASRASGGAVKSSTSGGARVSNDKPADLSRMKPTDLVAWLKESKPSDNE
jgi:hypothetical protein